MPRERYSRGSLSKSKGKPQKWLGDWFIYVGDKPVHRGPKLLKDEHGYPLLVSKVGKGEAQKHLDRTIEQDRAPGDQARAVETLRSYWARYCALKEPKWSKAMTSNIKWIFEKHVLESPIAAGLIPKNQTESRIGYTPLTALSRELLQSHLNTLAKTLSGSLVKKVKCYLKAMLDEAMEADLITKNPARKLDVPTTKPTCKRWLTDEECQRLLTQALHEGRSREHLIIRMCMSLGPRRGELFSLRRNDYQPGRLRIDESVDADCVLKGTKTRASDTWIPLPLTLETELVQWISALPHGECGFLFTGDEKGKPYRPANYLRRVLKPLAKRAGIAGVNFQSLRRTTATHGAKHGSQKDLQGAMRHSTPAMTMGVYAQSIPDGVRGLHQKLDDQITGKVN